MRQPGDRFASQAPTHKVSILQDLEQGKRLEVEEALGYAVRQAAELDVPTPTLDTNRLSCSHLLFQLDTLMLNHVFNHGRTDITRVHTVDTDTLLGIFQGRCFW
jgi:hypothetical protein